MTSDMGKYDFMKLQKKLAKNLDAERFQHTLGVMFTCTSLAMCYGYDIEAAQIAGLLHDCAKCIPNQKKIKLCRDNKVTITDFEKKHPFLIHAKLGAFLAKSKYDVEDREVLSAITYHTTGRANMSLLEKIVYIADYIEPMRDKAPNLPAIRKLAFEDLDECIYEIMKDTLIYLEQNPKDIDETTKEAFLYYKEIHIQKIAKKEENK